VQFLHLPLKSFDGFGEFHVAGTMAFATAGTFTAEALGDFMGFAFGLFGLIAETGGGEILGGFVQVLYAAFNFFGFTIMVMAAIVTFVVVAGMAAFP